MTDQIETPKTGFSLFDGSRFSIDTDLDQFRKDWTKAANDWLLLEVRSPLGQLRIVNPLAIAFAWEEE